jgi:hypothetical protein
MEDLKACHDLMPDPNPAQHEPPDRVHVIRDIPFIVPHA